MTGSVSLSLEDEEALPDTAGLRGCGLSSFIRRSASLAACGSSAVSAISTPLPSAVPPCGFRRSMAAATSSLLRLGACATAAVPAIATTPTLTLAGWSSSKTRAACCAARMRVGLMSCARMLPDRSMTRITVLMREGSVSRAWGRATATISAVSASSVRAGATWRRQPAPPRTGTPTDFSAG
ncbi:hypothetical protein D9M68_783090 [compost metagenome]